MGTTIHIPTLRTQRLILRAVRAGDWPELSALNADPVFRRYLGDGKPWTPEQTWAAMETALGQWALRGYGLWAVERDGRLVGRIGILHPADWPEPELAWGVAPADWGQGIAGEATAAVLAWAFATHGFDRLVSLIDRRNSNSRRVAEKLGAVREDTVTLRDFVAEVWVHTPAERGG